jgi:hypothetical protein
MGIKMAVFWDFAPYSHVEIDRRFRGAYCLRAMASEKSVISTRLHGATSQKKVTIILTVVRT